MYEITENEIISIDAESSINEIDKTSYPSKVEKKAIQKESN